MLHRIADLRRRAGRADCPGPPDVTLNTYTHLGLEDAEDELKRMEDLNNARNELDKNSRRNLITQKMFRVI